jgi:hypothetical protein
MNRLNVFQPGSQGSYGFDEWPFEKRKYRTGFLEHVPYGLDDGVTCIIDGHGVGFKSHDPTNLNEGLARYIRKIDGDLTNPVTGKKYVALMPAGGEWIQHQEWANMIMYAYHHPAVARIVISGLSGGAMRVLSLLMDSKYEKYVDMLAGAMVFSGKAVMRNLEQLKSVPLLAYHGVNDTVIRASNIVSIRKKAPENLTLNLFKAGHNTWDAAWNNIRRDTVSFRDFQSDPYVSVWRFLSAIDNGSSISKPTLPEGDIELYIDGEYIDDLYFNQPYLFRDFKIMIQKK